MPAGYDGPLYLMAFDHRGSFARDLFHASSPVPERTRAAVADAKELVFRAFERAVTTGAVPRGAAGVLVDEEFGAEVAHLAKAGGHLLAMPVEKSGREEFAFAYGDEFGRHIERFDPDFVKVLVRYNPEGDPELNARQTQRLARLSRWLRERDRRLLFELLVPPTGDQLERCGGDRFRFDSGLRPDLLLKTVQALQASGVEPDVWKIEGLEAEEDCRRFVAQARAEGRDDVGCVVLGRAAGEEKVLGWLRTAAAVPGFVGFAVGRTLWEAPLQELLARRITREAAVEAIADRYREAVEGFSAGVSRRREGGRVAGRPAAAARAAPGVPAGQAPGVQPSPRSGGTPPEPPRLLLADVDGTLVTDDKVLTDRAVEAVHGLKRAGILFAITSGRPPRGMSMLTGPLELTTPVAAFNGGVFVHSDMSVVSERTLEPSLVLPVVALLESYRLDVWLYRGTRWYVRDLDEPHIERESHTVRFAPTLVGDYADLVEGVAKIVGVSADHDAVEAAAGAARARFGDHVSAARSQPYYVDVTHPDANKGHVVEYLSQAFSVPAARIATIGDMPNDVLMFSRSGLSIAMGNAGREVQRAARRVTATNEDEGFAKAVERLLPHDGSARGGVGSGGPGAG